jgi:signal transduction histidine kinase
MEKPTKEVLHDLLAFSEALLNGDYSKRIITDVDDSSLSKISYTLNNFADKLQLNPTGSTADTESTINSFIEVISSFANRDFTTKLPVSESGNMLDAIATGINILGEELEQTTVSKQELEIERNELKIAKEKAEQSDRLKTIFLGNLSHEIRTPLQGISGFAEILESPHLPEEKRLQYLMFIKRRTTDLKNVIDSLLDLASLETGEFKSYPITIDLSDTVESIFTALYEDFEMKNKTVQLVLEDQLVKGSLAMIDPQHLKQVLVNIIGNSLKFTDQGIIRIQVKKESAAYCISISDTGIGIEQNKLQQIFEPFRQAHEGLSRSKGGIGLGLSICKKMVALWNGEISIESTPGKGTICSFTIPHA